MPHWRRPQQSEQTFEAEDHKTEVITAAPDLADTAQQLRHAREQIALAGQYPGRGRSLPSSANVITLRSPKT